MRNRTILNSLLLVSALAVAGNTEGESPDPLQGLNRKIHALNESLDTHIAKPVAGFYVKVTPDPVERRISNFFANFEDVNILLNNLLQLKPRDSISDAGRLIVNSTIGLAGLFDPASRMGLEKHEEDWGQTLGKWHIGPGAYFVLPLLGPSTIRDGIGLALDSVLNPLRFVHDVPARNSLYVLNKVSDRAGLLGLDSLIIGEKYNFFRDAYLQRRDFLIEDGEIDDLFDDDY